MNACPRCATRYTPARSLELEGLTWVRCPNCLDMYGLDLESKVHAQSAKATPVEDADTVVATPSRLGRCPAAPQIAGAATRKSDAPTRLVVMRPSQPRQPNPLPKRSFPRCVLPATVAPSAPPPATMSSAIASSRPSPLRWIALAGIPTLVVIASLVAASSAVASAPHAHDCATASQGATK